MDLKELADFSEGLLQANGLPPCRVHEFPPHCPELLVFDLEEVKLSDGEAAECHRFLRRARANVKTKKIEEIEAGFPVIRDLRLAIKQRDEGLVRARLNGISFRMALKNKRVDWDRINEYINQTKSVVDSAFKIIISNQIIELFGWEEWPPFGHSHILK